MSTNREAAIEDLKKLGVKALGNQLKDLATEILKLLSQAQREASQPDQHSRGAAPEWTTVLTQSVRNYQNQLVASMAERDPRAMWYAAGRFSDLPRFVYDQDHSWFSRDREFEQLLTTLLNTATAITRSINEFDPASMESARKALS